MTAVIFVGCSNDDSNGSDNTDQGSQTEDQVTEEVVEGLKEGTTLTDVLTKIQEDIGIAMGADIDDTILNDIIGISPEDVEQYAGQISMVMTSADTFIILEAKEGKVEDVKAALETRKQQIIDSAYTPSEIAKANAGIVYENGNYLALIVVGNTNVAEGEDFDSAKAKAEVEKAEEIVNSFFN